ncbi:hypothetical protein LRP67_06270 [Nocardioides sp. cx-169]|uniref:hypothetical protein n=1 Tax=Nocardioides sp. cx-169 TaxID=2899080 RepID=UPI001E58857F|nr:hypothetical protein [Nocardioides sp. cx-169]MCD4533682.1 hypothetical protein [Nocardioides sp. cx-169]
MPRDTAELYRALTYGTVDDLNRVYEPAWVNYAYASGTPLTLALSNPDTSQRVAIANRLLDDGADVREGQPLHLLLGRNEHDFTGEAKLLERMLDAGADVNEVVAKFGTPLETIAAKLKFSDAILTPYYDVLLARPDLDLLRPSLRGDTVLVNLRKMVGRRDELVVRAEQALTDRGIPVPPPAQ